MTAARVRFHTSARLEAEAAATWYEQRRPGLGADFVIELERAVTVISESPEAWPPSSHDPRTHRVILSRFPFSVVYMLLPGAEVVVVAVAHSRRRPGYWRERVVDEGRQ